MKPFLCSLALIFSCHFVSGQDYILKFSVGLSDSLTFSKVDWVDADHDGLLDIIAVASDANDQEAILLFKNDSLRQLQFVRYLNTKMAAAATLLTDADGDNMVDIISSGTANGQPVTKIFVNRGGFVFEEAVIVNASAGVVKMADFDQDGFREILLSGEEEPFLHILKRGTSGWSVIHDSIKVEATTVSIYDVDDDNDLDIFLAGKDASGTGVTRAYYNQKGFYFTAEDFSPAIQGVSGQADLNHDGMFDFLLAGKESGGETRHAAFLNHGAGFTVTDTLTAAGDPQIFAADLDSDGICDISLFGRDGEADTINLILKTDPAVTLTHAGVLSQAFGDGEYDGDLDLVQLTKGIDGFNLRILENNTETKNLPPTAPSKPIVANIFNRLFLYWDPSTDDHTVANSLTYDVAIQSPGETLMTPHFNVFNGRRLTVSHGNNGTARYVLIRIDEAAPVNFSIQAVDNSLFGSIGGICNGSGGGGNSGLCTNVVEMENLEGCKNEMVTLSAGGMAHWFSFRDGFLADAAVMTVDFQKPDTIFSVQRQADCAEIKVYTLAVVQTITKKIESTLQVCEGTTLRLGVEPGWPVVEWSSTITGFLSGSDSVDYVVTVPDTVKVRVSDGVGCAVQRNTALKISKPVIEIVNEAYQILRGQSVQLSVSGGASYQWAPAASLNDSHTSHPVASPLNTTEYTVVATDSLGCRASARILVMVEEAAFVPNLFTPNRDGTNDELKIYGLGQVTGFSFTIFNREGNKVYHTKNISDAVNNGWNGMTGGVDQPSGVYYWNIEGETATGRRLQLNGKITGSIVLVR